jgi:hypothetical protein
MDPVLSAAFTIAVGKPARQRALRSAVENRAVRRFTAPHFGEHEETLECAGGERGRDRRT